jgi:hypothetical protein
VDQRSIEELFERNADMRLLELRHNEPGKGAPPNRRVASFGAESIMTGTPDLEIEQGAQLRVGIAAAPASGVIPGAVVGVAIDVYNDGDEPAPESKLQLSLPLESEYRAGTLRIDGREPQSPEALFSHGLPIPRVLGSTSAKVTFQLAILAGINVLYLQPRLTAEGVPVVGTAGISIKRGTTAGAIAEAPRPFYELEDDEVAEVARETAEPILPPVLHEPEPLPVPKPLPVPEPALAATIAEKPPAALAPVLPEPAAAVPTAPVVALQPPVPALVAPPVPAPPVALELEPPVAPAKPPVLEAAPAAEPPGLPLITPVTVAASETTAETDAKPKPKAAPPKRARKLVPAQPEDAPQSEPAAASAAAAAQKPAIGAAPAPEPKMARFRTLGNNDLALLDRLFSGEAPGLIAHYVLISSVACCEPQAGDDTSGYGPFLRRDIESLGRALVHSRMGKAPQYRIVQSDLDALAIPWETMPPPAFPAPRRLRRDLRRTEWAAIAGLTQPSERDATLRTRIALLALAGAAVEGVDGRTADDCAAALAGYRSAVLAWLVPLCVASAGNDAFVIPAPPAGVDSAGRKLVGVLKTALTA